MQGFNDYLATEVLTAPPQKLQLLLIEAAIRQVQLAQHRWKEGDGNAAQEAVIQAQEVVAELIGGVQAPESATARQVLALYHFLHERLLEASLHKNPDLLPEVLAVLKIERETWTQMCAVLGSQQVEPTVGPRMSFEA